MNCYEFAQDFTVKVNIVGSIKIDLPMYFPLGWLEPTQITSQFEFDAETSKPGTPYTIADLCAMRTTGTAPGDPSNPWMIRGSSCKEFYKLWSNIGGRVPVGDPNDPDFRNIYMSFSALGRGVMPWYDPLDPYAAMFYRKVKSGQAPANFMLGFFDLEANGQTFSSENLSQYNWNDNAGKTSNTLIQWTIREPDPNNPDDPGEYIYANAEVQATRTFEFT